MDAQSKGKLSGLIGRFGNLVTIRKKYKLPICVVANKFANSMIVKTIEEAEKAVSYLK